MSSRSDHGIRMPHVGPRVQKARPREATTLPPGLPHYELLREFRHDPDHHDLWHYAVQLDDNYVPKLAESSPPPLQPLDLAALFGSTDALEIEICTGKGRFLAEYAALHPDRPLLGVEWTRPVAWYAAQRLAKVKVPHHAHILWGDAQFLLRDRMPAACCKAFHIYFPDPWPKHRQRRVLQPDLLKQMRRLALDGCVFHWGTDHSEYNQDALQLLGGTEGFRLLDPAAGPTDGIRTSFETKYIQEGRDIFRSIWAVEPG
jgi:tRNA (guanine-N7-)-methyltransferase